MKRAIRVVLICSAALAALLILVVVVLLALRKPWVEPLAGVNMTPQRTDLEAAEVAPDSAYALLLQAVELPAAHREFCQHPWLSKVQHQGLPEHLAAAAERVAPLDPAALSALLDFEVERAAGTGSIFRAHEEELGPMPFAADLPWTDKEEQALAACLQLLAPNLALARQASQQPHPQVATVVDFAAVLNHLNPARDLVFIMALEARILAAAGEFDAAAEELLAAARFGDILSRGGGLLSFLVSFSCHAIVLSETWKIGLSSGWNDSALTRLAEQLQQIEAAAEPAAEALRYDAKTIPSLVDKTFENSQIPAALGFVTGTRTRIESDLLACYTHLVSYAETRDPAPAQDPTRMLSINWPRRIIGIEDPVGYRLASMTLPGAITFVGHGDRRDVFFRLFRAWIAVARYRLANDALPTNLDQLVPAYLREVPADVYGDGPIRYANDETGWRVYSIGTDGIDNGGAGASLLGAGPHNPDFVVPGQPFPELKK